MLLICFFLKIFMLIKILTVAKWYKPVNSSMKNIWVQYHFMHLYKFAETSTTKMVKTWFCSILDVRFHNQCNTFFKMFVSRYFVELLTFQNVLMLNVWNFQMPRHCKIKQISILKYFNFFFSYQPPHLRRRLKIQEIVQKYKREMSKPELLTYLFTNTWIIKTKCVSNQKALLIRNYLQVKNVK